MNKQMWWHSIVILLLCVGCTADGVKRTSMPNIMYPASAQFTSTPTPLALNQHGRTVSYITELAPAEIVQYYVNEKKSRWMG
ncbi:MAG TPA: hypothetical protein DEF47_10720 [Herpetosiphon sp.]|nr:hypothetical protein [Herpetosiphon sp.]